jgi:hypothetical protein
MPSEVVLAWRLARPSSARFGVAGRSALASCWSSRLAITGSDLALLAFTQDAETAFCPARRLATLRVRSRLSSMSEPFKEMMTSPCLKPALAAGLSSTTPATMAPLALPTPRLAAMSGVKF